VALVDPIEGFGLVLRCVEERDAEFALALRSDRELARYMPALAVDLAQQRAWIAKQRDTPGDWYFLIERRYGGQPEGLISLYACDRVRNRAEWGRWILKLGSLAAWESEFLLHRFAIEHLGLDEDYCFTIALNNRALALHDQMGAARASVSAGHYELDGQRHDAIEHRMTRPLWLQARAPAEAAARRFARALGAPRSG